ncbi:MAG: AraC family transcriptional regulator [Vallitalea sp.]|nr:AraC family transcriptional regulator [Vallitalea sp.]
MVREEETEKKQELPIRTIVDVVNKYPFHYHNGLVIMKVITGNIKVKVTTGESYLEENDFIIFNVYEIHQIECMDDNNKVSITYINDSYCKSVINEFDYMLFFCNSSKYEKYHRKKYSILRNYIDKLIDSSLSHNKNIEKNSTKFLLYLSENFDFVTCGIGMKKFSRKITERNRQLYKSVMLIDGENNRYSLKEVASEIGVNYSYLRQDVVERYGHGYKWLKYHIMTERAMKMLLSTNEPITFICQHCKFSDPKYMIQYFKKYFGCTPSEFRNIYKDSYCGECEIEEIYSD